jgi:hypothetical protein
MVSGHDVVLLGDLAVRTTQENTEGSCLPIALYMAFDDEGQIKKLTIAMVDLQPLAEALRKAVEVPTAG